MTEPGDPPRELRLDGVVSLGRAGTDVQFADPAVSRRHAVIDTSGAWPTVVDAGSAFGTYVNGVAVAAATPLSVGSVVRVGDTELLVLPATDDGAPLMGELRGHGVVVSFRRGSAAELEAPQVLAQAAEARHGLRGVGSEASRPAVQVRLVEYLPARDGEAAISRRGFAVEHITNSVWVACSAESPAQSPAAGLAVLFATEPAPGSPADARAVLLAEGYGLHITGASDDPELLADNDGVDLDDPPAELRAAVAVSWVRYLVRRDGEAAVLQLLSATASGDSFDGAFRRIFGRPYSQLEGQWLDEAVEGKAPVIPVGDFARLSVRLLKPYKWRQFEVFGYMLFSLAFGAAYPFVARELIDTAIPSGEWAQVVTLLGLLGGAFVVSVAASIRESYQSTHISSSVVNDLRAQIYDRVQDLPMSWFANRSQGEVMSRLFSDVGAVQSSLTKAIGTGIFQSLSLVVSSVILLTLEWRLGLIILLGAPVVAVIYKAMSAGARRKSTAVQEDSSTLFTVAAENYQAQAVVKVFDLGDRERTRFAHATSRLFRSQKRMALFSELFGASVNVFVTLLRLGVMGFGAWLIFQGEFSVGGLVAFLGVVGEVLGPVTGLVGLGQGFQEASGALARVQEVLDLQPERPADPERPVLAPFTDRLELRDVRFLYNGRHLALDGIDLTIRAGSRVAFVGPSGSGKSTIMRLLMRLDDPSSGELLVDGVPLPTVQLGSWRRQLGVVMQDSFLFDMTVRENIAIGAPAADDAAVRRAAATAEVDEFATRLPRGFETMVGERGAALSGGQRQRVAIARAVVRDPRLLLLDEATSALDPHTERQIADTLQRLAVGRTTIAVTHRLASVADYDQIFVVAAGRIAEQGTHTQLLAAHGLYAELWAEQNEPVPTPGFDPVAALSRVAVFANLPTGVLGSLVGAMQQLRLEPGDRLPEADQLVFVAAGTADVEVPHGQRRIATARLQVGDAFGLARALGVDSSSELVAVEPTTVALLAGDTWRLLAAAPG
ncbi:MAG: ABC transporter transmembrane domain-containing protein [Actinomycetota bacterium]|nr:ABC transporter transmembrane domain-containing protein [Actinomycetota bacterium]